MSEAGRRTGEALHPVLQGAPHAVHVYRLGADGRVRLAGYNPAAERSLGSVHPGLLARTVEECLPMLAGTDIPARLAAVAGAGGQLEVDSIDVGEGDAGRCFRAYAFPMGPGCAVLNILDVTARRRVDEALRASEARFRGVFDNGPFAMLVVDRVGTIVSSNARLRELLGYAAEDLVGKSYPDITHPEDVAASVAVVGDFLRSGAPTATLDKRYLCKDGGVVYAQTTVSAIRDGDGRVLQFVAQIRDLTAHRITEEALRAREQQYRTLVENSVDVVVRFDRAGRCLYMSPAVRRLTHRTPESFVGHTAREYGFPAEFCARFEEQVARVVATGEVVELAADLVTPIGGARHLLWRLIPERDEGGALVSILGIVNDLTASRQAERSIQESRDTAAAFVTHMPTGLIILGWDGGDRLVIEEANPAAQRIFPGQVESWLRRPLDEVWPLARGGLNAALLDVVRTGRPMTATEVATFSKPARWLRVHAFPLPGRRLAVSGEEITGEKQAAAERARLEEQLRQAQRMESIGRLAGGVAHDFNNYLTGILGNVSLLRMRRDVSDPVYPILLEIEQASERAAGLTRQLLAFSRKHVIEPRAIDLNALLGELRRMLARLLGEDVRLLLVAGADLGLVRADPGQIEQIIVNLAVNARDAMPAGGTLTFETRGAVLDDAYCRAHAGARPGAFVELAVSDTGSGMTEEVKAHLFEPFFTTKELGKGTGLGLAMVYGAVQQNQGFLEVYSEVGRGTTFKVYLPRASGSAARRARLDDDEPLPHGDETILLVEDEPMVRDVALRLLRELGYRVLPCANADEALACARTQGAIDLLLTDVVMPGRTGPELAAALKVERPALRVLYCSGYTENVIVDRGVLEPGVQYISKPYLPLALAKKIREVLAG